MHSKSKRFLSIVLCVLMLATLFPFSALSADVFAIDFDTQSLNESYSEGESFTIPVQIKNNPGVNAIGLTVSYPQNVFSIELTEGVVCASDQDVSDADFAFTGTDTLTGNGILFYAKFTVLENVTSGDYSISLGITGNEPSNLADENYKPIDCSLGSCTIKVNGTAAAANLTFTDGSWSAGFEAANSEGVSAVVPQAAPTGATYYFLGWFSGLDAAANDGIFTKENDRYVLSASKAANAVAEKVKGVTFTATEFVPKYNQGELGNYNALWLKDDRDVYDVVDMLVIKGGSVTYMVADYTTAGDNAVQVNALSLAAAAEANGGGTIKMVRDFVIGGECSNIAANFGYPENGAFMSCASGQSFTLDMNGCSVTNGNTIHFTDYDNNLAPYIRGGMIRVFGTLNIVNSSNKESTISENSCAAYGGTSAQDKYAIVYIEDGKLNVKDVNFATTQGTASFGVPAVYINRWSGSPSAKLENCNVTATMAEGSMVPAIYDTGSLTLIGCNITGNCNLIEYYGTQTINIEDSSFKQTAASNSASMFYGGGSGSSPVFNFKGSNTFDAYMYIFNHNGANITVNFETINNSFKNAAGTSGGLACYGTVTYNAPEGYAFNELYTDIKGEYNVRGQFYEAITVTFIANGQPTIKTFNKGDTVTADGVATPVFADEGLYSYSFGGWSLLDNQSDPKFAADLSDISTNTTLYAIKVPTKNEPSIVVEVGGVQQGEGYASLEAAIDAAPAGATVKFVKDFTDTSTSNYIIDKNLTIDMNGKNVDIPKFFYIKVGCTNLTFDDTSAAKNGSINYIGDDTNVIYAYFKQAESDRVTINVNGGTLKTKAAHVFELVAFWWAGYGFNINLNGGYIKSADTAIYASALDGTDSLKVYWNAGGIYADNLLYNTWDDFFEKDKFYVTLPAGKVVSSVPLANGYYELILEHDTVTGNTAKLCVYNTDNKEYSFANNYKVKFLTDAIDAVKALALNHDLELKVEAKNVDGAAAAFDVTLTDTVTGNPVGFTAADGVEITIPATVKANTTYKLFYKEGNSWTQDSVYTTTEAADSITVKVDHFSEYMLKEAAAFGTEITVGTVKDYDVGDTVTATVKLNATQAATLRSYQFNVIVPAGLELESIELADGFKNDGSSAINGIKVAGACKGGVAIAANGEVQLATLTFKVTTAAVDEADVEISLENILVSAVDEGEDIAVDANSSEEITLHNVVITVNGGNATVGGADSLAFYAKYNEADKLYVDAARTIAATTPAVVAKDGYSLADTLFVNAADATDTAADFAALAGKTFTKTAAYTVQTAKTYTLTFSAENAHCIAIGSTVTLNEGDNIKASLPAVINDTGYENGKWYVVSGETETELADTATISADTTVKYKAAAQTHTIDLADLAALTVSDKTNISADNKVTMGKEVSFKVASGDTSVITGITVQIGDTYTNNYAVNNNGTWTVTIPAAKITDNIVVTAETDDIGTVTFKQGANATLEGADANGSVTKYIVVGQAGIYNSAADAKSNTAGTVPTATAKTGYRLADNAWAVGGCTYNTAALGNVVFADGTEITVNTVKTYTVTFTATNAILSSTGVVVDAGTDLASVVYPTVTPADGYTFTGWDKTAGAVNADTTVTAALTQDSYTITAASTPAATVTVPAGPFTYGESVNVTVVPNTGFTVTKVSYVVNGVSTELTKGADNTYALTAKGSGMIVVEANGTYTVTFTVDAAKGTVTGATSVTKAAGEKLASSDIPTVTAKGGYVFTGWSISDDGLTYAAQFEDAAYKTSTGDYVKHGTDYTFTPEVKGKVITGVTAKIGDADVTVTQNDDGSYTIAGADIVGNIDITYVELDAEFEFITFNQYKALQENTKIAVLKTAKLASGNYMLGSELGYYSAKYEGYLWIVADNATAEQLAAKLSKDATAAVLTVDYDMDVNGNGVVTATDAGIIYDALKNHSVSSWAQIFELDVNGDKVVTATDVMLILNNVVGLD